MARISSISLAVGALPVKWMVNLIESSSVGMPVSEPTNVADARRLRRAANQQLAGPAKSQYRTSTA